MRRDVGNDEVLTPVQTPASPLQVLLVDDSLLVRRLVAQHLRHTGHVVLEAADGAEALDLFRKHPVAIVVTDIGMPRLGGLELLAALRDNDPAPEVILLTGSHAGDAQAAVQALRLGAHDYISKDCPIGEELTLAVARASEKWQLREENARLLRELQRLSLTDALTSLGNRRAFDQALRQEAARARRQCADLSLALFDIDRFKRVNDTMGHPAGDAVLAGFARRLQDVARESDRLFRHGGEEFAVLLGETDESGAAGLAERVRAAVARTPFSAGARSTRLTCSAGVAELAPADVSPEALLRRADSALYDAKRQGRNRVVTAPPPSGRECVVSGLSLRSLEGTC